MLIVTTAATVEPVTATEAKQRLRITHTSDDALLEALITSAREAVEMNTGRALAAAEYRWAGAGEMAEALSLPLWPVATVTAVSYEDENGTRQTMAEGDYTLDGDRATVAIDEMPDYAVNPTVAFTVSPENIPNALKDAIILFVGTLYDDPQARLEDNAALDRLMYPYRVSLGL